MESLRDLAPLHLPNRRVRRYQGDDLCLSLSQFAPPDQAAIREVYVFLQRLFVALTGPEESRRPAVVDLLREQSVDRLVGMVTPIGAASYRANPSPLMAKTIHDIRGGGLTPLLGQLQFLEVDHDVEAMNALFFLTRDHLKIMRNALLGLDDAQRESDLLPKAHSTRMIAEKHHGALLHSHGRSVRVEVICPEHMNISECCVEFGALDRILYNLLNNACRHAATDTLRLALLPVPDMPGENLRLVLINAVSEADAEYLRRVDLATLFEYGVSTTNSGSGLSVAAQFVGNAFGLDSPKEAVAERYLGARLVENDFAVWFHWPVLAEY
jgi:signal transduction histidine kinase